MYKIFFFCPEDQTEKVKEAMFNAGAGRLGNYQRCSWQTKGIGQFQAMDGANPFLGDIDKLETVEEYKVEMLVSEEDLDNTIQALKKAHPYEEPAWEVYKIYKS